MSLIRKTILITGASRGLGKELARYLWDKGANLILVSKDSSLLHRTLDALKIRYQQKVDYFACDLSKEESLVDLTDRLKSFEIDAIINNAAIQGPIGNLIINNWEEWKLTIQTNLLSPVFICRALLPNMLARAPQGASIINLSGGGVTGPRPNFSAYAAAKSGLVSFSATLAEELKNTNVRVNSIAPGAMPTDMLKKVIDVGLHIAGEKEHKAAKKIVEEQNNSFIRVAELCEFLISDKSKDVSGKLISAIWDPWEDFDKFSSELNKSDIYTLRRVTTEDRAHIFGRIEKNLAAYNNLKVH